MTFEEAFNSESDSENFATIDEPKQAPPIFEEGDKLLVFVNLTWGPKKT